MISYCILVNNSWSSGNCYRLKKRDPTSQRIHVFFFKLVTNWGRKINFFLLSISIQDEVWKDCSFSRIENEPCCTSCVSKGRRIRKIDGIASISVLPWLDRFDRSRPNVDFELDATTWLAFARLWRIFLMSCAPETPEISHPIHPSHHKSWMHIYSILERIYVLKADDGKRTFSPMFCSWQPFHTVFVFVVVIFEAQLYLNWFTFLLFFLTITILSCRFQNTLDRMTNLVPVCSTCVQRQEKTDFPFSDLIIENRIECAIKELGRNRNQITIYWDDLFIYPRGCIHRGTKPLSGSNWYPYLALTLYLFGSRRR